MIRPDRRSVLVLLAVIGGTAFCAGCMKQHPLREEFDRAFLVYQYEPSDLPPSDGETAHIRRFVSQHGREVAPLYRSVIADLRYPRSYLEQCEFEVAVEGLARVEGTDALPLLLDLVADTDVSLGTLKQGILLLPPDAHGEVLRALRTRFEHETDSQGRVEIVYFLSRLANPAAIPMLREFAARETDAGLRDQMKWGALVLQTPEVCRFSGAQRILKESGWYWSCNYRCAGERQSNTTNVEGECPDTIPSRPNDRR
ncbi:hypothetical protein D7X55_01120 [Corallococcus sp. AB049A]|nr:hypothetical protein D7X55_01120 [Corallococcus sp. AB049A]